LKNPIREISDNQESANSSPYRLDHLNEEERINLISLLKQYQHIEYKEGDQLSFSNQEKHIINTTHSSALHTKPYSYPQAYEQEVEHQIQDMLNQGIIRPSNSPYCSPIWIVPKKQDASGKKNSES